MGNNDRQAGDQADALAHNVLGRNIVRIFIIRIKSKGRTRQLVHDIAAGRAHDHILGEVHREVTRISHGGGKAVELFAVRQRTGEQQIADLLEAEAVFRVIGIDEVVNIDTAIGQTALDRHALAFVKQIAVNVAETGDTGEHAGAVRVAQTALDAVTHENIAADVVERLDLFAEFVDDCLVDVLFVINHSGDAPL